MSKIAIECADARLRAAFPTLTVGRPSAQGWHVPVGKVPVVCVPTRYRMMENDGQEKNICNSVSYGTGRSAEPPVMN